MSNAKIYQQYCFIAGLKTPILSTVISSQAGSLANLNIAVNYSPFITRLHEYTKIQIWEQVTIDGVKQEPSLEFDGVIVGIQRKRNLLGEVYVSLSCLTDGAVWNIRKQTDFYLQEIVDADTRGTGNAVNMRADGQIDDYFTNILQANYFDVGCAIASILTSHTHASVEDLDVKEKQNPIVGYYKYNFNGKSFSRTITKDFTPSDANNINPAYYNKFLTNYKLANKVYGTSTTNSIKDYFKINKFISMVTGNINDVKGENTFWQLAMTVAQYGFFSVYDIPNPTFIKSEKKSDDIDLEKLQPTDTKADDVEVHPEATTLLSQGAKDSPSKYPRVYKGLAEYIFKPKSILGIPFKCNVIWPDQVLEESIFYDFFNTPTRILYQRSAVPVEKNILTTKVMVGPDFPDNGYLHSLTLPREKGTLRSGDIYTDYEAEYGIKYIRLNLSQAFDNALLKDLGDSENGGDKKEEVITKLNNYLNYEFTQNYLGTRQYSVMVTPDCNPVVGFPLIVLNKMGEHVIAFCTGIRKAWSAGGQKTVSLTVGYPRYYYEDFGDLGNVIDTISQEPSSLKEVGELIGSTPIGKLNTDNKSFAATRNAIKDMFTNYQDNQNSNTSDILKESYKRKSCTLAQFMDLYDQLDNLNSKTDMPNAYLINKLDSSSRANNLSCRYFEVYDSITKDVVSYENVSSQNIVSYHLDWIKDPKRI